MLIKGACKAHGESLDPKKLKHGTVQIDSSLLGPEERE